MTQGIARDARGVSHALSCDAMDNPGEISTLCGVKGRLKHLTAWWSPLTIELVPGEVDCMACLVAEARQ